LVGFKEIVSKFTTRGTFVPLVEIPHYAEIARKEDKPLYQSLFTFTKLPTSIAEANSTEVYLDEYILDIDKGNESNEFTLIKAQKLYENIVKEYKIKPIVYFSGTGYHLYLPDIFEFGKFQDVSIVKHTMAENFPDIDDIYDKTRIIRVPNTINLKSNLYKTLLTEKEFFGDVQDILAKAKEPSTTIHKPFIDYKTFPYKKIIFPHKKEEKTKETIKTNSYVTCMQNLYNEGAKKGTRHISMLRLTSAYRRAGVPLLAIKSILRDWASDMSTDEVDKIVEYTFDKEYTYSCKDPIMNKYCDPKCIFYKNKNYVEEVFDAENSLEDYKAFLQKDIITNSINLRDIYILPNDFYIYPGEFVMVIAETKIGKSAWVQNIVTKFKLKTLYLSLEMNPRLTFRRFLQIANGYSKEEITQNINTISIDPIKHIEISSTLTNLDSITKYVKEKDFKVIVVDVIDALDANYTKSGDKIEFLAPEIKRIANDLDIIIIGIHHISKYSSREHTLDIHSGKGSSGAEQKADKIIGIEGNRENTLRKIKVLGARDESTFEIFADACPKTFRFYQLTEEINE